MPTAQEMVDLYTQAEMKILAGQQVEMNGRKLTRANLNEVRQGRLEWERKVSTKKRGRGYAKAGFSQ